MCLGQFILFKLILNEVTYAPYIAAIPRHLLFLDYLIIEYVFYILK